MLDPALEAIERDDLATLKRFAQDSQFRSILGRCTGRALKLSRVEIVQWLLPQCDRDDGGFEDSLDILADTGNGECLELVLTHWNDQEHHDKALIWVAIDGNGRAVQQIVDRCSAMGISLALTYSARHNHDEVIDILYDWCTIDVLRACRNDNPQCAYLAQRIDAEQSRQDLTSTLHHQDNHLTKPKKM